MEKLINSYRNDIIKRLNEITSYWENTLTLGQSMNYTLLNSGKLVRSVLMLLGVNELGLDYKNILDVACALEMIQSYSLIHDDLPEMDNATLRRGKTANHLVYGHSTALLAGDALLTDSFNVLASCNLDSNIKLELIKLFSQKAGSLGVCFGQELDIINEKIPFEKWEDIEKIICNKTCALFIVAFKSIGMVTNLNDEKLIKLERAGYLTGLAFQLQDDLNDTYKSIKDIGKDNLQDLNKNTYHKLFGEEKTVCKINELMKQTNEILIEIFGNNNNIIKYLKTIIK